MLQREAPPTSPAKAALPAEKQGLRFHDLRHTCATLLIDAGRARSSYRSGGHSSITTTLNLYGHVLPSTEAALVDAVDAIYEQCDESELRQPRRGVERARGLK